MNKNNKKFTHLFCCNLFIIHIQFIFFSTLLLCQFGAGIIQTRERISVVLIPPWSVLWASVIYNLDS